MKRSASDCFEGIEGMLGAARHAHEIGGGIER
jgi:hypothetical protein